MLAYFRTLTRRKVVVNLRSGTAFEGILYAKRGPLVVLRNATMHGPGNARPAAVDGSVVVERSEIEFIQVIG
jgi:small nuclear ribonucleoprotein (snRNP)-like protein